MVPALAQNSPAGGLAAGNVINRDVDTYMMVNFAPFVNYDNFFSFAQAAYTAVHAPAPLTQMPGFQAGFGKRLGGNFLHFYLNTNGYSLDDVTETAETAETEKTITDGKLNLQFDSLLGTANLGIFKLGMNFSNAGKKETFDSSTDKKETIYSGYFFPTLEYGWNIIHDDFSMLLVGGKVGVRIPINNGNTITEINTAGVTTTTTSTVAANLTYPAADFYNNTRVEIAPQIWIFFTPKLDPMVIISSLYLINTTTFQIYPDEMKTIEQAGLANGYTKRAHSYVGDTLFGYYNRQYAVSPKLSAAWRVNFSTGFYYDKKGYTYEKAVPGAVETETQTENEVLFLTLNIAPRLAFGYQVIPATLQLNGALVLNPIGPTNAIGWQYYRRTTTDTKADKIIMENEHIFTGINPILNMGAAWNLNPHLLFEAGISVNTSAAARFINEINIGAVYKR